MNKILVAEDDMNTNQVITEFLKDAGYDTVAVYDGNTARDKLYEMHFDLVILDIMLPGENGLDILKELRQFLDTPVMILTALGDEYTQVKSYDLLADEYVTKPFSPKILVKKAEALLRRSKQISSTEYGFDDIQIDFHGYSVNKNGKMLSLTTREFEILQFLIRNRGQVVTREQIIMAVWEIGTEVSDRIIDTHIKNIRKKLDTKRIRTVKGIGYQFEQDV
ncbi:MAG: response regulator transcription factor [Lachnospiraceae bacterium]|nr:response regulator transcription factor [Lachnospiraceae bacterium]